jgi:predicted phage terminase large subunit-like protein
MSIDFSAKLSTSSDAELLSLIGKLEQIQDVQRKTAELSRSEFRQRYPTPGALAKAYFTKTRQTPALDAIDEALVDLADAEGAEGRQMIFVPPQEGKSTRASCWFPLWLLAQDPSLRIAIVVYSAEKAERWGRWIRRMIEAHSDLGITLAPDSRAVDRFETTAGGVVLSVGIDGGLTSEAVDLLIIDDPLKGRAEAESSTYRKRCWDWWESNAMTRASDQFRVVLMMTRWHSDDLAGRLLAEEPGEWNVLRIPAVRDEGSARVRGSDGASVFHPNGELISVRNRPAGWFLGLKSKRSMYVWNSIYMQTPVAAEGNLFARADFRYWSFMQPDRTRHDALLGAQINIEGVRFFVSDMVRFITVDLAASKKTSADYTVASVWGITGSGRLVLLDMKRARLGEEEHWTLVAPLCKRWACPDVYVEKSFISSTLVRDATQMGLRIQPVAPDTDKITRSIPAANRVRAHTVHWPDYVGWLDEWEDEIAGFPQWAHDDMADTLFYAGRIASAHWTPPHGVAERTRDEWTIRADSVAAEHAYRASTGMAGEIDLSRAQW